MADLRVRGSEQATARRHRPWMRLLRWVVSILAVLLVAGLAAVTWYYSNQLRQDLLTPTHEDPQYDVRVHAVGLDDVTLERTDDTILVGIHGVEWEGGYGQVGAEVVDVGAGRVQRAFHALEGTLAAGDHVRVDRWAFPGDPQAAHEIPFEEVNVTSPVGELSAWFVDGISDTWAIFVHGKGADPREALRTLPLTVELGLPSIVITYRNDEDAPSSPDRRYHLGDTEWQDLESAVHYALDHGATGVVLVGYSMGGQIVGHFLLRSELSDRARGAILDAPVLDWGAAVDLGGSQRGLPQFLTSMAKVLSSLRFGIDWDDVELLDRADEFRPPILLIHGTADGRAPVDVSDRFAAARPDIVEYERFEGAEHVGAWNLDPVRYEEAVRDFLKRVT